MRKVLIIGLLFFCSFSFGQNLFVKDSQNRQVYFDKEFVKWSIFFESRYVQLIPNGPLVDIFGGNASLPYVSGFGVDQIFDLSPLSDNRWNKNAYIGNSFGLPEYYDFPYISEIYFDTGNPFHWKIKDCHYRYYEEQADALTNIAFAKLTYVEGILQSSDELLLYNDELTDVNLIATKKYIGILPDYLGSNIIINGTFDTDTDWTKGSAWTISGGIASVDGGIANGSLLTQNIFPVLVPKSGTAYKVLFDVLNSISGDAQCYSPIGGYVSVPTGYNGQFEMTYTSDGSYQFFVFRNINSTSFSIDNVSMQKFMINYYNGEE